MPITDCSEIISHVPPVLPSMKRIDFKIASKVETTPFQRAGALEDFSLGKHGDTIGTAKKAANKLWEF